MKGTAVPVDLGAGRVSRALERLRAGEDGQSLVEFALCLPPVLLLMTGIFAFG
jgi:Flp pilus assembly protein TadG